MRAAENRLSATLETIKINRPSHVLYVQRPACLYQDRTVQISARLTQIRNYLFAWHDLERTKSKLGHVSVYQVHFQRVICSIIRGFLHRWFKKLGAIGGRTWDCSYQIDPAMNRFANERKSFFERTGQSIEKCSRMAFRRNVDDSFGERARRKVLRTIVDRLHFAENEGKARAG